MADTRIVLSGLWIAVMLTYLWGDVLQIFAGLVVVFNLFGLPYKGAYDNFLIIVSFVFNALTIWYAWRWV